MLLAARDRRGAVMTIDRELREFERAIAAGDQVTIMRLAPAVLRIARCQPPREGAYDPSESERVTFHERGAPGGPQLPTRVSRALEANGLWTAGAVADLSERELDLLEGIGPVSCLDIVAWLEGLGLKIREDDETPRYSTDEFEGWAWNVIRSRRAQRFGAPPPAPTPADQLDAALEHQRELNAHRCCQVPYNHVHLDPQHAGQCDCCDGRCIRAQNERKLAEARRAR